MCEDLTRLGVSLLSRGNYFEAEGVLRQALGILRASRGDEHAETTDTLDLLAAICTVVGDFRAAEPLCRKTVESNRRNWGADHPNYASSLTNLATLYRDMGDYSRALPLYRQTLDIFRSHGDQLNSAATLDNMARLYMVTFDGKNAERSSGKR